MKYTTLLLLTILLCFSCGTDEELIEVAEETPIQYEPVVCLDDRVQLIGVWKTITAVHNADGILVFDRDTSISRFNENGSFSSSKWSSFCNSPRHQSSKWELTSCDLAVSGTYYLNGGAGIDFGWSFSAKKRVNEDRIILVFKGSASQCYNQRRHIELFR